MLLKHPEAASIPVEQFTSGLVLTATRGDAISGFAALARRPDSDIELDGLFVEPDLWKQGIGTCLIAAAEALAIARGHTHIHVVANSRAQDFYARCGYALVGTTNLTWRPALLMLKRIN